MAFPLIYSLSTRSERLLGVIRSFTSAGEPNSIEWFRFMNEKEETLKSKAEGVAKVVASVGFVLAKLACGSKAHAIQA